MYRIVYLDSGFAGVYRYRSGTVQLVQRLAAYAHTYIDVHSYVDRLPTWRR